MYTPPLFAHDDPAALRAVMTQHPFALLVTPHDGEVHLTHLPVRLDADRGAHGTLEAHLARANPHGDALAAGAPSVVVFGGPNAYVSPRWYADPTKNVPTWSYVAVHAHGKPRIIDDADAVLAMIGRLTDDHEVGIEPPWSVQEARAHAEKLVRGVIGFELEITRIEGKFKVSQNRSPEDQGRVREALGAHPITAWMDELLR